jgi:hypothetical protein
MSINMGVVEQIVAIGFFFFETGSPYVAHASFECEVLCLCLPSAGIIVMYHHAQLDYGILSRYYEKHR